MIIKTAAKGTVSDHGKFNKSLRAIKKWSDVQIWPPGHTLGTPGVYATYIVVHRF